MEKVKHKLKNQDYFKIIIQAKKNNKKKTKLKIKIKIPNKKKRIRSSNKPLIKRIIIKSYLKILLIIKMISQSHKNKLNKMIIKKKPIKNNKKIKVVVYLQIWTRVTRINSLYFHLILKIKDQNYSPPLIKTIIIIILNKIVYFLNWLINKNKLKETYFPI